MMQRSLRSAKGQILLALRSGEQTDDCLRHEAKARGVSEEMYELAVDELMDEGLIVPSIIQARDPGLGDRFYASLRAA